MNNTIFVVRWAHRAEFPGTFTWDRPSFRVSVISVLPQCCHTVRQDHPATVDASLSQTIRPMQPGAHRTGICPDCRSVCRRLLLLSRRVELRNSPREAVELCQFNSLHRQPPQEAMMVTSPGATWPSRDWLKYVIRVSPVPGLFVSSAFLCLH